MISNCKLEIAESNKAIENLKKKFRES